MQVEQGEDETQRGVQAEARTQTRIQMPKRRRRETKNSTARKKRKKEKATQRTKTKTTKKKKKTQGWKQRRRKEKRKKRKKREHRADDEGEAENSTGEARNITSELGQPDEPKTVEREIYRRERKRKLRKLNDGGKLEIVHVSAHNRTDFEPMILRPMGRLRSKNEQSRRARAEGILECEGGGF